VSALAEARAHLVRRARQLEELVKARLEVDMSGVVAGVRARVESRLSLQPILVGADLADKPGPLGLGHVRTSAWECPEARKVVLSQVSMRPLIEGVALVIHPSPKRAAPIFGADLMALPTRLSVNADVYGPPALCRGVLTDLGESFQRLGSHAGPTWAQSLASGEGLHAKCSLRLVDDVFAALTASVGHYLDALTRAPATSDSDDSAARDFFAAFHANGPRRGPLGRVFGAAWAERYSRLIFE
jgi:hypothetical protein